MSYQCPVCGYEKMAYPPQDYNICPCCGTEFEADDFDKTHAQLRAEWLLNPIWVSQRVAPPVGWNPYTQLANLDKSQTRVSAEGSYMVKVVYLSRTQRIVPNANYKVNEHLGLTQVGGEMRLVGV